MEVTRRELIKGLGLSVLGLTLNLNSLTIKRVGATTSTGSDQGQYPYRGWEDLYRKEWTWDSIAKVTHWPVNCRAGCEFDAYVKDGIVVREEQTGEYPLPSDPTIPDFNPRGCQKGACYSERMYDATRIKYPLKRVGKRGEGKWKRISWDEAVTEIAENIINVIENHSPEQIFLPEGTNLDYEQSPHVNKYRFADLLGGTVVDDWGPLNDLNQGAGVAIGQCHVDGTSNEWFLSDYIILARFNPMLTQIPDAHFLTEARYRGATVVSIAPDYNPSSIHADLWVNLKPATDAALFLGMANVIVNEKLYDTASVKEQTDMPILIRLDTGKFLRESDLKPGGKLHIYYCWDLKSNGIKEMPGTMDSPSDKIVLTDIDPALEGIYEVTLPDGKRVKVTTVFEKLKEHLAKYTPEKAENITGVKRSLIIKMARDFVKAKAACINSGWGSNKWYHSDLMNRAAILILSLAGHMGKPGGGFYCNTWYFLEGWVNFSFPTIVKHNAAKAYGYGFGAPTMGPGTINQWYHAGFNEISGKAEYVSNQGLKRPINEYVEEAVKKGWMPCIPAPEKRPKFILCCGVNVLRFWRLPQQILKHLFGNADFILNINFRMDSTALYSDMILPAAGWYEKRGIKYPISYVPFINYSTQAVPPLFESKKEWEIMGLILKKVQEMAKERDITKYKDGVLGIERDLTRVYDEYITVGGKQYSLTSEEDETELIQYILDSSTPTKGIKVKDLERDGIALLRSSGASGPPYGVRGPLKDQVAIAYGEHREEKKRWPTMTGRQQAYIDHDWYQEFNEELPVHKEPPYAGGKYPLKFTGGHTRWSIHSMWRDDKLMLRLTRGQPTIWISIEDANQRGIKDGNWVRVRNDLASFKAIAKVAAMMRPGQVWFDHAWELYQFENRMSEHFLIPTPIKPLTLVGNYGHLVYFQGHVQPGSYDRDTLVEIEKV